MRGSALITVVVLAAIMAVLTASIMSYSLFERRSTERQRLILATRTVTENVLNYTAAQLPAKLYRLRSSSSIQFTTGSNKIYSPPEDTVLSTPYGKPEIEFYAGLTKSTGLTYIDPTKSENNTHNYKGLSIITSTVPAVAKATLKHSSLGSYTAYLEQDLTIAQIPIFQFAIFYNMNLEFGPGADMIISGPVHANGSIAARCQTGKTATVQFDDRVTCTGGLYANVTKFGAIYGNTGVADTEPGGTGKLNFTSPTGVRTNLYGSSTWRDHAYSSDGKGTETDNTISKFASFATGTYSGNLRTSANGSTEPLQLVGTADDNTGAARKNKDRAIIEPPDNAKDTAKLVQTKFSRHAGLYIIVNPTDTTQVGIKPDGTTVTMPKYTYRCWINSLGTDGVTHTITEVVLPGQPCYGADATGIPYVNNLPNRFTNITAIGSNQVLRIPSIGNTVYGQNPASYMNGTVSTSPLSTPTRWPDTTGYQTVNPTTISMTSFTDAYFYDLRRADGSEGYPASRGSTNPFKPRPIAKIDFDMTRFKLAVERTVFGAVSSTKIYNPDVPNSTNWSYNILNPSAVTQSYGLAPKTGTSTYTVFPQNTSGVVTSDPFRIYFATAPGETPMPLNTGDLINTGSSSTPWYDGIAIYIHSAGAENRTYDTTTGMRNRMDSGVRFWNGRGLAPSLTNTGRTGLSIATNDAAYIVGHFNADGTINSTANSTGYGGYSARYPENSDEKLCSIMTDALTVLSQPVYKKDGSDYVQISGWSDSLSPHTYSTNNWSSSWQTTNPGSKNQYEGINIERYTADTPNRGTQTSGGTKHSTKLPASSTEISACLLTGIVRTTSPDYPRGKEADNTTVLTYQTKGYQNSGGVHNFPRMLEYWSNDGVTLCLRTSMVAMFESEVACEPWLGTRIYSAPTRLWGFHENLRAEKVASGEHDVPLEPMAINVARRHFSEIQPSEYDARVAEISALATE